MTKFKLITKAGNLGSISDFISVIEKEILYLIKTIKTDKVLLQLKCDLFEMRELYKKISKKQIDISGSYNSKKISINLTPTHCLLFIKYSNLFEQKSSVDYSKYLINEYSRVFHKQITDYNGH